jgi:predicted nucleic acid-binding protein
VLADTSVWIDHFKRRNSTLEQFLEKDAVSCHEFVVGELACGTLRHRAEILGLLSGLQTVPTVDHEEALHFLSERRLMGRGLGWVDVHLLASAIVTGEQLFTLDRRLAAAASAMGIALE